MRRLVPILLAALAPLAGAAQQPAPDGPPTGLTASISLGGGGELGLDSGKAGVVELEAAVGWEFEAVGLTPVAKLEGAQGKPVWVYRGSDL